MIGLVLRAIIVLLFFLSPTVAYADCAEYGATAVAQQKENIELGCGISGLRWHTDEASHAGFCRLVGEGLVSSETALREVELAKCRPVEELEVEDKQPDQCQRSEIAEGTGKTRQSAMGAAQDLLGRERAEMTNSGLTKCLYHDLGCTGPNGNKTCFLSVGCCAK